MLGNLFLAFVAAVAFATIVAVVAGLVLAAASAMAHDLYVGVIREDHVTPQEQVRAARIATVIVGAMAITIGILAKGQNVAHLVALAFAVASSANLPVRAADAVLEALQHRRHRARHDRRHVRRDRAGAGLAEPDLSARRSRPRRRRSSRPRPRTSTKLDADLTAATEAPAQDKVKAAIAKSEKAKAAAEAKIKEIGTDAHVDRRAREAGVRSAQPGPHLDPARLPRRDHRLAAVSRQARRGHVGRALRAPEHRPPAGQARSALTSLR